MYVYMSIIKVLLVVSIKCQIGRAFSIIKYLVELKAEHCNNLTNGIRYELQYKCVYICDLIFYINMYLLITECYYIHNTVDNNKRQELNVFHSSHLNIFISLWRMSSWKLLNTIKGKEKKRENAPTHVCTYIATIDIQRICLFLFFQTNQQTYTVRLFVYLLSGQGNRIVNINSMYWYCI